MKLLPTGSKPAPTDLEILNAIYDKYYDEFVAYSEGADEDADRSSKILVPIDLIAIAQELDVDRDIVFGRLYYDLEKRYGYRRGDEDKNRRVVFFTRAAGADQHCVNFPYLSSVVANLRAEKVKYFWTWVISLGSLAIALISLVVSL